MTRRRELVLRIVLNEISDDYENLHQITKQVGMTIAGCGMTVSLDEILQGLTDLIDAKLAKAYRFSDGAHQLPGMPPLDEIGSPHEVQGRRRVFLGYEEGYAPTAFGLPGLALR